MLRISGIAAFQASTEMEAKCSSIPSPLGRAKGCRPLGPDDSWAYLPLIRFPSRSGFPSPRFKQPALARQPTNQESITLAPQRFNQLIQLAAHPLLVGISEGGIVGGHALYVGIATPDLCTGLGFLRLVVQSHKIQEASFKLEALPKVLLLADKGGVEIIIRIPMLSPLTRLQVIARLGAPA